MPAHTLNGKTPFEMKLTRKPNLANIHEFGAATYVKDLKARKLDSQTIVGHFIGYDLESKGYRIYWPTKRTISVKRNVVINDYISRQHHLGFRGHIEGEREKIIQSVPKSSEDSEDPNSLQKTDSQSKQDEEEVNNEPLPSNTIPFPSTQPETAQNVQEITNETQTQAYRRGQCK